jgi:O-antigen ligase
MLASKAGFIAALISILMAMWVWFKNFKSIARAITMAVLCIGIMAASIKLLPASAERVSNAIVDAQNTSAPLANEKKEAHSSTELRMVTWSAAGTLLLEHPLGVGTGDTESELINKYVQANENYAAERKLNAHNQFLQAGAEHGWLGILLLIACMLVLTYYALKWQNIVMLNFVLLCGMNFLFESFLEVQAGLVFFGFFVFVFVKSEQNT